MAWRFQERIAFPAPRAPLPDPPPQGLQDAERIALTMADGTRLHGWYVPPFPRPSPTFPGLLWFYGNGETIAAIWPVLREFRPPRTALLVVDYPGYGASEGRSTEPALYEAADLAYAALAARPGVDPARVRIYGRSLGTAVATHVAATHPVAGLVLESPFTNARDVAARHYAPFPRFLIRLKLDNLGAITRIQCPVLVLHGTRDRLVPLEMGKRVAEAASGPVELVLIEGAGHNETYDVGGIAYRDKVWSFLQAETPPA
ncbi:MAG TPA: alpha/beta hydrolase [Gemmatimonadales bacterium]|nr:alpha/beta hydrolase [Gemmatimonadales bacterium]